MRQQFKNLEEIAKAYSAYLYRRLTSESSTLVYRKQYLRAAIKEEIYLLYKHYDREFRSRNRFDVRDERALERVKRNLRISAKHYSIRHKHTCLSSA